MTSPRRTNFKARAVRAGAKSPADFELFDYLYVARKAMRTAAREDESDEVARNMSRIYDLMLKYGRFFQLSPRSKKYKKGESKQCYGNSLDLVIAHDELSYCEGVIVSRVSRTSDRRIRKTVYDERGADPQQPAADLPGLRRA